MQAGRRVVNAPTTPFDLWYAVWDTLLNIMSCGWFHVCVSRKWPVCCFKDVAASHQSLFLELFFPEESMR